MRTEFDALFKLGRAEKLQLVEDLWDSLAMEKNIIPVSESKTEELRSRKVNFLKSPKSARSWDDVKHRARAGK